MRFPLLLMTFLAAIVCASARMDAQAISGTIAGTVTASPTAVLAGAGVTVRNETVNIVRTVTTDERGFYSVDNLPVQGDYEVRVEFSGFAPVVQSGVSLTANASVTVNISMRAASEETLVVTGRLPTLNHDQSAVQQTVSETLVHALPIIGRDFLTLTSLTAGFSGNPNYPSAQGQLYWSTNVIVDGASHYSKWRGAARTFYSGYPLEAIKDVRVLSSQYSAEYGEALASITSATSHSGTNQLHGSTLLFVQQTVFSDIPAFTPTRPPFGAQRFGATLGGPITQDRTHFFSSYEGRRQRGNGVVTSPAASGALSENNEDEHLFFFKVDHKAHDRDLLTARYNGQRFRWRDEPGGLTLPGTGTQVKDDVHTFLVTDTTLVSSAMLNEVRAQFSRYTDLKTDLNPSVYISRAGYSIQGGLLGPYGFGATPEDTWEGADTLSYRVRSHAIKFGGGLKYVTVHNESLPYGRGAYFFAGTPNLFPQPYAFYQSIATSEEAASADPKSLATFAFAQDDWRVNPWLTVNLGVRYDVESVRNITGFDAAADRNNVQPRVGAAWEPIPGKLVVRGGIGIYNQQHLLFYINKVQLEGAGGTTTLGLAPGAPLMPTFPNLLPSPLPNAPPRDIQQLAPEFRNPYSLQATFGVEQQLFGLVIGADYIHLRGRDLMSLVDINAPVSNVKPNSRTVAQADATRPIVPVVSGVRKMVQLGNKGDSWYRALQIKVNRSAGRLQTIGSYTFAKSEDQANYLLPEDSRDLVAEKGRADNDIRHNLALGFTWQVPVVWRVLNGMALSGIGSVRSGRPYTEFWGDDRNGTSQNDARPAGRNSRTTAAFTNIDLALSRQFRIKEKALEGRIEAFNVLSRTNYDQYVGTLGSSLYAQPVTAYPRRRLQFAAIVRF